MTRIQEPARPIPSGIITEGYIHDVDLGVIKTGKEADVHLVERVAPDATCLLALKRYRPADERGFRNDAAYRAHRRIDGLARDRGGPKRRRAGGRSLQLAMDKRTSFGRAALHQQWISAEWATLSKLWTAGATVPYPVHLSGDEILMEYVGDSERAAPRLADARVERADLPGLFEQAREAVMGFARAGIVHADLSPYNVLVWDERLWVIDLPQAVPYLENLGATEFLHRDCINVCAWFVRKGFDVDPEALFVDALTVLFDYRMEDMFHAHE